MYEKLLDEAQQNGITVIEKYPFASPRIRGLCCDDTIAISAQVDTEVERTVVLCEELTHALHSYGNILSDARMERRTRERIFDRFYTTDKSRTRKTTGLGLAIVKRFVTQMGGDVKAELVDDMFTVMVKLPEA